MDGPTHGRTVPVAVAAPVSAVLTRWQWPVPRCRLVTTTADCLSVLAGRQSHIPGQLTLQFSDRHADRPAGAATMRVFRELSRWSALDAVFLFQPCPAAERLVNSQQRGHLSSYQVQSVRGRVRSVTESLGAVVGLGEV